MLTASSLAIEMRYRDVAAAADWLCTAFGFEKQSVALSESGAVLYAQLIFGNAMLMLAPVRDAPLDRFMKQPDETGGAETQSCYFVVDDASVHYARAKAAGAEILLDLHDDVFGGRGYSCRDPEGHIWAFGTYDPWQGKRPQPATARGSNQRAVLAVLAAAMIVSAVTAAWVSSALRQPATVSSTVQVQESPFQEKVAFETEQRAREAAKRAAQEAREQLEIEFAAVTAAAERANQAQIDAARTASEAARVAQEARDNLDRERAARAAAAQHDEDLQKHAAEAERAREAAERAAQAKTALVVGPAGMITSQDKVLPSQEKALPEPAQPPALAPARTEDPERPALPSAEEKAHAESALTLGEKYFVDGRVLVAREFFRRAVDAGLAAGALRLAATYDPLELERLRVQGIVPDRALARRWYQRARELGAPEAEERLAKLGDN